MKFTDRPWRDQPMIFDDLLDLDRMHEVIDPARHGVVANTEIADHLDRMHDLLLERGRAKGTFGRLRGGPVCLAGASLFSNSPLSARVAAMELISERLAPLSPILWNDTIATDDDVFDLLRDLAKELRG